MEEKMGKVSINKVGKMQNPPDYIISAIKLNDFTNEGKLCMALHPIKLEFAPNCNVFFGSESINYSKGLFL